MINCLSLVKMIQEIPLYLSTFFLSPRTKHIIMKILPINI